MSALPPHAFPVSGGAMSDHVAATLSRFGTSLLSDREAEVAQICNAEDRCKLGRLWPPLLLMPPRRGG